MKYVDHPDLPAIAPINHPHLLKDQRPEKVNCAALCLCDAIVTLLHQLEAKEPGILKDFLNLGVEYFKLVRLAGDAGPDTSMNLSIRRVENVVSIGLYTDHATTEGVRKWHFVCDSNICKDGSWSVNWGGNDANTPSHCMLLPTSIELHPLLFGYKALNVSHVLGKYIYRYFLWVKSDESWFQLHTQMSKVSHFRISKGEAADGKASDGKASNSKVSQSKISGGKISGGRVDNSKVSKSKVSKGKASDGNVTEDEELKVEYKMEEDLE